MTGVRHLTAAAAAFGLALLASGARAGEEQAFGISLDGYVAPVWDDSITRMSTAEAQNRSRGLVGVATLANFGPYAAGAIVDGFPGIFGNGRMTVGGLAGWQPQVGARRFQVLGELGAERFSDVGGTVAGASGTRETWLDYVAARLGTSEALGPGDRFELGAWLFVRKDLGQATVTNSSSRPFGGDATTADYRLGGYTAGAALRFGLRFDQQRLASAEPVETAPDRP